MVRRFAKLDGGTSCRVSTWLRRCYISMGNGSNSLAGRPCYIDRKVRLFSLRARRYLAPIRVLGTSSCSLLEAPRTIPGKVIPLNILIPSNTFESSHPRLSPHSTVMLGRKRRGASECGSLHELHAAWWQRRNALNDEPYQSSSTLTTGRVVFFFGYMDIPQIGLQESWLNRQSDSHTGDGRAHHND